MKIAWIITQIIKLVWTDITLNMQSCKTAKGFALHRFHVSVLSLRSSDTETDNPMCSNTHAVLTPSR